MNKKAFSLIELSIVILIIGILIAGITASSSLVKKSKLSTARGLTKSSPVISIQGLVAWFDATSKDSFGNSELDDGDSISTWNDINPTTTSNISATQATSANQPTYQEQGINDLPTILFDGSNDYFIADDLSDLVLQNHTIFLVVNNKYQSGAPIYDILSWNYNNGSSNGPMLYFGNSTQLMGYFASSSTTTTTTVGDSNIIFSAIISGNTTKLYINSNLEGSGNYTIPAGTQKFSIGQEYDSGLTPSNFLNGQIGEIIFFDRALKKSEKEDIEKYLSKKWNIKLTP